MKTYRTKETVTCKATVQRSSANYDPLTSVLIYVYKVGTSTPIVDGLPMTKESKGVYVYDFQTVSQAVGKYRWTCKATDGVKIAIEDDSFEMVA